MISVIIPCKNAAKTVDICLTAVYSSGYKNYEVVVVDDHSQDNSVELISRFPCKLIRLNGRSGASAARNAGARNSRGDVLFFIDADCVLAEDSLLVAERTLKEKGENTIAGGTYTKKPYDNGFFSSFQSVFINYSETKNSDNPDYIAAHAMVIDAGTFRKSGGFPEDFLPILEDVEFSHRLKRAGYRLYMNPGLQVRHIFNFSLWKSLRNAARKARYWIMYSIMNRDLHRDSGTASLELKINGVSYLFTLMLAALGILTGNAAILLSIPVIFMLNIFMSRGLISAFYDAGGIYFAASAALYYTMVYPSAVWTGAAAGALEYLLTSAGERS